jgi:hypothetical protein
MSGSQPSWKSLTFYRTHGREKEENLHRNEHTTVVGMDFLNLYNMLDGVQNHFIIHINKLVIALWHLGTLVFNVPLLLKNP